MGSDAITDLQPQKSRRVGRLKFDLAIRTAAGGGFGERIQEGVLTGR